SWSVAVSGHDYHRPPLQSFPKVAPWRASHEIRCTSRSIGIGAGRPFPLAFYLPREARSRDGAERPGCNRFADGRRRPTARRLDRDIRAEFVRAHEPAAFAAYANDGPRGGVRAGGCHG